MSSDLEWVMKYKRGEIELGSPWGVPGLDSYRLFKRNFTVILGIAGAGKTSLEVYLQFCMAIMKGHKVLVWSSENAPGELKLGLINAMCERDIKYLKDEELIKAAYEVVEEYVDFVDTTKATSLYGVMDAIKFRIDSGQKFGSVIIDPWSSLKVDEVKGKYKSKYEYSYDALTDLRSFQKQLDIAIYLCLHPSSSKAREKHADGHRFAGMTKPLTSSDAEFGSMFDNRADDYFIYHRYKYDEQVRNQTHCHVAKIKNLLTGGRETPIDSPIVFEKHATTHRWYVEGVDILEYALEHQHK